MMREYISIKYSDPTRFSFLAVCGGGQDVDDGLPQSLLCLYRDEFERLVSFLTLNCGLSY
jgi:hypothetical protein